MASFLETFPCCLTVGKSLRPVGPQSLEPAAVATSGLHEEEGSDKAGAVAAAAVLEVAEVEMLRNCRVAVAAASGGLFSGIFFPFPWSAEGPPAANFPFPFSLDSLAAGPSAAKVLPVCPRRPAQFPRPLHSTGLRLCQARPSRTPPSEQAVYAEARVEVSRVSRPPERFC